MLEHLIPVLAGTLAAVFADAAASGRTVLHVPATSADGHAVAAALREEGLGSMVLDLTEDAAWRQHASEGIRESLGVQPPQLDVAAIIASRRLRGNSASAGTATGFSILRIRRHCMNSSAPIPMAKPTAMPAMDSADPSACGLRRA